MLRRSGPSNGDKDAIFRLDEFFKVSGCALISAVQVIRNLGNSITLDQAGAQESKIVNRVGPAFRVSSSGKPLAKHSLGTALINNKQAFACKRRTFIQAICRTAAAEFSSCKTMSAATAKYLRRGIRATYWRRPRLVKS